MCKKNPDSLGKCSISERGHALHLFLFLLRSLETVCVTVCVHPQRKHLSLILSKNLNVNLGHCIMTVRLKHKDYWEWRIKCSTSAHQVHKCACFAKRLISTGRGQAK